MAELVQTMTEGFTGHRVIKAYNLEKIVAEKFRETAHRSVNLLMRITRATEMPSVLIEFFGACGLALMLAYLVRSVRRPAAAHGFSATDHLPRLHLSAVEKPDAAAKSSGPGTGRHRTRF